MHCHKNSLTPVHDALWVGMFCHHAAGYPHSCAVSPAQSLTSSPACSPDFIGERQHTSHFTWPIMPCAAAAPADKQGCKFVGAKGIPLDRHRAHDADQLDPILHHQRWHLLQRVPHLFSAVRLHVYAGRAGGGPFGCLHACSIKQLQPATSATGAHAILCCVQRISTWCPARACCQCLPALVVLRVTRSPC